MARLELTNQVAVLGISVIHSVHPLSSFPSFCCLERPTVHSSMPWYGFLAVSSAPVVHGTSSFQLQGGESAAEGAQASVDGQALRLSTHVAHFASTNCPPIRSRAASSPSHGSEALPGVLSSTSRNCERAFTCPPGHRPPTSAYMRMPHALQLRARYP